MKKLTVKEHWGAYEQMVVPADADARQRVDMKASFYAGAAAAVAIIREVLASNDISTEDCVAIIAGLDDEVAAFANEFLLQALLDNVPTEDQKPN